MNCNCEKCKCACVNKPGWFRPGEAEGVAEYLGLTLKECFEQKLVIDYYFGEELNEKDTFVLAPAVNGVKSGSLMPFNPMGQCIFYSLYHFHFAISRKKSNSSPVGVVVISGTSPYNK